MVLDPDGIVFQRTGRIEVVVIVIVLGARRMFVRQVLAERVVLYPVAGLDTGGCDWERPWAGRTAFCVFLYAEHFSYIQNQH